MRKLIVVALLALASMTSAVAQETQLNKRCALAGNWVGIGSGGTAATMLVTYTELSPSSGILDLDFPVNPVPFGFPADAKVTSMRGVWQRTGNHTFVATFVFLVVGSDETILMIGRVRNYDNVSDDCNLITVIEAKLDFFLPTQNPFVDSPVAGPYPLASHQIYRMSVVAP